MSVSYRSGTFGRLRSFYFFTSVPLLVLLNRSEVRSSHIPILQVSQVAQLAGGRERIQSSLKPTSFYPLRLSWLWVKSFAIATSLNPQDNLAI